MSIVPDVDDPLLRLITLLQSADDCLAVGRKHIGPHITQLSAFREQLREKHGDRWWNTFNIPPLWPTTPSNKNPEESTPE